MSRLAVTSGVVIVIGAVAACAPRANPPPASSPVGLRSPADGDRDGRGVRGEAGEAGEGVLGGAGAGEVAGRPAATAYQLVEPADHGGGGPLIANRVDAEPAVPRQVRVPFVTVVRAPRAADLGDLAGVPLVARLETSLGVIHCHLRGDRAPATVAGFVGLATGAKAWASPGGDVLRGVPFYDGLEFHRVIPDFMIQGGDPLGIGVGGPGYEFADEVVADLRHDGPGVLSMANAGPDTNGSQFFITDGPAPWLDGKHTVFGRCDELDVIDRIAHVPTGKRDRPLEPVVIRSLTISGS